MDIQFSPAALETAAKVIEDACEVSPQTAKRVLDEITEILSKGALLGTSSPGIGRTTPSQ
jgi:ribosome maturation factor RimP